MNMEAAEAQLLAMLTGGSAAATATATAARTPSLVSGKKQMKRPHSVGRMNKNRSSSSSKNCGNAIASSSSSSYSSSFDVIARQFRQDDGTVLSVASTMREQQADAALLRGTVIVVVAVDHHDETTTTPLVHHGAGDGLGENAAAGALMCRFEATRASARCNVENSKDPRQVLRILRGASRGNFASVFVDKNSSSSLFFTPWFDATDRWFLLSMYLASRFELTLWTAFYQRQQIVGFSRTAIPRTTVSPHNSAALRQRPPLEQLSDGTLSTLYAAALARTIKEVLEKDGAALVSSPLKCHIRDSDLWDLLTDDGRFLVDHSSRRPLPGGKSSRQVVEDLWVCPLTELGSKMDTWRRRVRVQMQVLLAEHTMQELLLHDLEGTISDETCVANNTTKFARLRRPKRRKNIKRRDHSSNCTRQASHATNDPTNPDDVSRFCRSDNDDSSSSSGAIDVNDEDKARVPVALGMLHHRPAQANQTTRKDTGIGHYRGSGVSSRDRNRHTVLALSILEDALTNVFQQVGLVPVEASTTSGKTTETSFRLPEEESREEPFHVVRRGGGTGVAAIKTVRPKKEAPAKVLRGDTLVATIPSPGMDGFAKATDPEAQHLSWDFNDHRIFPPIRHEDDDPPIVQQFPHIRNANLFSGDPTATIRTSNLQGFSSSGCDTLSAGFFLRPECHGGASWEMPGHSAVDGWGRIRGFGRDKSILTEFFHMQENDGVAIASSTAASIASDDAALESPVEVDSADEVIFSGYAQLEDPATPSDQFGSRVSRAPSTPTTELIDSVAPLPTTPVFEDDKSRSDSDFQSPSPPSTPSPTLSPILVSLSDLSQMPIESLEQLGIAPARSLSSESIASRPSLPLERPTVPQMVSRLSRDNLRTSFSADEPDGKRGARLSTKATETSIYNKSAAGRPSKSRDDHDIIDKATVRRSADALSSYRKLVLRPGSSRDDHDIKVPVRETPTRINSYRNVAARGSLAPGISFSKFIVTDSPRKGFGHFHFESMTSGKHNDGMLSTRSETALDGRDDYQSWHETSGSKNDDVDNNTITKDGTTTISSGMSQREPEEILMLREQRNAYRDMCLTLGAENAKLKTLLAAQRNSTIQPSMGMQPGMQPGYGYPPFRNGGIFDPASVTQSFHIAPRARTLAAMSDAGYRGEQESLASEDDVAARILASESLRQLSSGVTVAESDASLDHNSGYNIIHMPIGVQHSRDMRDNVSLNAMQSRLARDIFQFLETTTAQLRKLDVKIQSAVERMNRLVKTVWPRAQVKLYGSHVTGLCVPTSDLDFVVCLPAVHKNAVADAPGALEGRNAINETSQKLLARRLKGESWIDPRSMKLIDRTVVPVIKVATKDTKKQTLHLDISFDAPGHHGLEAVQMIASLMVELPVLRPLVVVLKQFLIERSLLEAYTGKRRPFRHCGPLASLTPTCLILLRFCTRPTGGLSSYCLSLMVARYLQEQSSGADVGSLLMGFLDFYGNHVRSTVASLAQSHLFVDVVSSPSFPPQFDPRSTGISVRHRRYFARPNYFAARNQGRAPMWDPMIEANPIPAAPSLRRNSFSDKESTNVTSGRSSRSQAYHPPPPFHPQPVPAVQAEQNSFDNGMPYTFDPLFVEDPLSSGNNVGRNAFRIFQVQRAFSDAHRALVAALEWDMHSAGELQDTNEFPLLKCLLQSEDVVYDL